MCYNRKKNYVYAEVNRRVKFFFIRLKIRHKSVSKLKYFIEEI